MALFAVLRPPLCWTTPALGIPPLGRMLFGTVSCPEPSLVTKNLGVIRPLLGALLLPFSNDAVEESGLAQIGDGEGV